MSYIEWKSLRKLALSSCAAAEASVRFSEIARDSFGLADEYNGLMDQDLENIFKFIDRNALSNVVNLSGLQRKFHRRHESGGGFGTGLPGIANKFSALHILAEKIDRTYEQELSTVAKVEHALLTLDRRLLLLENIRTRWTDAFTSGTEVKLEALGGLHLFEYGIWAFKTDGQRAQTDLILQQEVGPEAVTAPLVMTEWKKATSFDDAKEKIEQAIRQCDLYQNGVLKPLQVDKHRFVIIVTKLPLLIAEDRQAGSIKYLIRNIATERRTPSAEARAST